jgi:hypothetical protein
MELLFVYSLYIQFLGLGYRALIRFYMGASVYLFADFR